MDVELVVEPGAEDAVRRAGELLAGAARAGGHIALSGGSTPAPAYRLAAQLEPDWSKVQLWWGDERCVPPEDERSNFRLARETLLDGLGTPPAIVHRVLGELEPDAAAAAYEGALADVRLDFALNGIGADGHTASLFPEAPALFEERRRAVAAEAGLEPFVPRVTMTRRVFAEARLVYLVIGPEKAEVVRRAFAEPPSPATPASLVRGATTIAVVDAAAAVRCTCS